MVNMEQIRGPEPLEPLTENSSLSEKKDESGLTTPDEARENVRADGKRELVENDCYDLMAYNWPSWKKWMYLSSVAVIQIAMNYNTSVYPSVVPQLTEHFGITEQKARTGQMIYLIFYSFGCELWAPWSEEFGRWPILVASELLIIIWTLPQALATNLSLIHI